MKIQTNRPKGGLSILLLLFFLLFTTALHAQTDRVDFCQDFDSSGFGNWQAQNVSVSIGNPGPSGQPNDNYLHGLDRSGASYMWNSVDYSGDWTTRLGDCLCWDFRSIDLGNSTTPIRPTFQIRHSNGGSWATFAANFTVSPSDGWVHVCAPIELCTNGTYPSNGSGSWNMGGLTGCQAFNDLLANVGQVRIFFDYSNDPSEEVGYDNICIQNCDITNNDGAYCCDSTNNLILNGNFEAGFADFTSDYANQSNLAANSVAPGQFMVGNGVDALDVCANWLADDPSGCVGYPNQNSLFVNGRTQQSGNTSNVIWRQTIDSLNTDSTYKFCGKFRNLPTCCFDVPPRVRVSVSGGPGWGGLIATNPNDPCDWQEISGTFVPLSSSVTIEITLSHTGNGDGNDLAIDDLALLALPPAQVPLTVLHQSSPQLVTGSFAGITTADDVLPDSSCEYIWAVAEVASINPMQTVPGTIMLGNNTTPNNWSLTTNFPGYPFQVDRLYVVGMMVNNCECAGENFNLHYIYVLQNGMIRMDEGWFSPEEIESMLQNLPKGEEKELLQNIRQQGTSQTIPAEFAPSPALRFLPNPTRDRVTVNGSASQTPLEICNLQGQILRTLKVEQGQEIDLSQLPAGVYFFRYSLNGVTSTQKIILQ